MKVLPATPAERMEVTAKELARRLFEHKQSIRTALGGRPYKGAPLSKQDQISRYTEVRNDPQAWLDLMKQNFKVKEDGHILAPKGMLKEFGAMEKTLREGVL